MECDPQRIESADVLHDAVVRRLLVPLPREGAEQPVPDHQHARHAQIHQEVAGLRGRRGERVHGPVLGVDQRQTGERGLERNHGEGNREKQIRQIQFPVHARQIAAGTIHERKAFWWTMPGSREYYRSALRAAAKNGVQVSRLR